MVPSLPLLSSESSVSVKENPDRKKKVTMIFIFFIVLKRLVITKNSVVKIQNRVMNHESRPVKSNPGVAVFYVF